MTNQIVIASPLFRDRNCKWLMNPGLVIARNQPLAARPERPWREATRQSMPFEFMDCRASLAMTAGFLQSPKAAAIAMTKVRVVNSGKIKIRRINTESQQQKETGSHANI